MADDSKATALTPILGALAHTLDQACSSYSMYYVGLHIHSKKKRLFR